MAQQHRTRIADWVDDGAAVATDVVVWPVGHDSDNFPQLADRATIVINTGCAAVHLRPTAAELRDLIAKLEWALRERACDAPDRRESLIRQLERGLAAGVAA